MPNYDQTRYHASTDPSFRCSRCGGEAEPSRWTPGTLLRGLCFHCTFWTRHVEAKDDPESVRVGGVHYRIGDASDKVRALFRGFGGSLFIIRFFDGREVSTTDLWCQGEIPPEFREELPDNAVFVSETSKKGASK